MDYRSVEVGDDKMTEGERTLRKGIIIFFGKRCEPFMDELIEEFTKEVAHRVYGLTKAKEKMR